MAKDFTYILESPGGRQYAGCDCAADAHHITAQRSRDNLGTWRVVTTDNVWQYLDGELVEDES